MEGGEEVITVEIRINGSPITVVTAVNRGDGSLPAKYDVHAVTFPMDSDGVPLVRSGEVTHRRADGANVLAELLIRFAADGKIP
jgi:hypothetical protein